MNVCHTFNCSKHHSQSFLRTSMTTTIHKQLLNMLRRDQLSSLLDDGGPKAVMRSRQKSQTPRHQLLKLLKRLVCTVRACRVTQAQNAVHPSPPPPPPPLTTAAVVYLRTAIATASASSHCFQLWYSVRAVFIFKQYCFEVFMLLFLFLCTPFPITMFSFFS